MKDPEIKVIGVVAPAPAEGLKRLLDGLATNFPVRFEFRQREDYQGLDAVMLLQAVRSEADRVIQAGLSCYAEILDPAAPPASAAREVQFAKGSEAPFPFAGRVLRLSEELAAQTIRPAGADAVVTSLAGRPIWTQSTDSNVRGTFVSLKVPELAAGEFVFQHFNKHKFLNLLPLIDFIKRLIEGPSWVRPRLRACLMFDDPNLHWKTYGFMDFQKLAEHAVAHRYHSAIATIPLDAWLVNPPVARLFRAHRPQLSLLVHGNNHVKKELARPYSEQQRLVLVRQALERIAALERKANLEVSRVMAPPFGACSEDMMMAMKSAGFEAACISHGSLRAHNSQKPWVKTLGLGTANLIRGFPVMPRFRISRDCQNDIYLAAYLNQAIIPVGHHEDAAGGMTLLAETAHTINSLGEVVWASAGTLARMNYSSRLADERLHVRARARKINLTIRGQVSELLFESDVPEPFELIRESGERQEVRDSAPTAVSLVDGERLRIVCRAAEAVSANGVQPLPVWPFLRRQATECRDRLKPFVRRGAR